MITGRKAKKDLFTRFKEAIIEFFSEKPVKKSFKGKTVRKPAKKLKKAVKHPKKRALKKAKKPRKKQAPRKPKKEAPQPPKHKETPPMPAPWSKVAKYKKVKKDNYFFYGF